MYMFKESLIFFLSVCKVKHSPDCDSWVTENKHHSLPVITPAGLAFKYWSESQCHPCGSLIVLCWSEYQPGRSAKVQDAILQRSDNLQTFGVLIFPRLPQWPLPNLKVHLEGILIWAEQGAIGDRGTNPVLRRLRVFVEWGVLALAPGMEQKGLLSALQAG